MAVGVAEEQDALALALGLGAGLNPLAHSGGAPHGSQEAKEAAAGVGTVVLAHDGTDGVAGLVGVVKGNGANVVVEDVRLDNAVQQLAADEAHLAVNGSGGTADVVPLLGSVVRQRRVGVLEESDGNEPVVDPEVGDEVPDSHVGPAKGVAEVEETSGSQGDTNVAVDDELGVLGVEDGALGVEVVDTTAETVLLALTTALALAAVEVVASDVGNEVLGPTDELLAEEVDQSEDGSLLSELRDLVDETTSAGSKLLTGTGQENHVTLHVAGGLVVLAVGDLPAEEGDEQGRVQDPAGEVVDGGGLGEGTVTALVSNDPETSSEEALEDGVDGPKGSAGEDVGDVLGRDKVMEQGEGAGEAGNVAEDVVVTLEGRALEAVLGDGITDVLDGVVGRGEFVAVGVDELAVGFLFLGDVDRGEGGERGGRGRGTGRVHGRDNGGGVCRVDGLCDVSAQHTVAGDGGRGHVGMCRWWCSLPIEWDTDCRKSGGEVK